MHEPAEERRYLEDFEAGQARTYGAYTLTEEEVVAFAEQFDPQPMHRDPELAQETRYGGLIASGWHTTCIAMRLAVLEGYLQDLAVVAGVGVENLRWTAPVRPGDTLTVEETILEATPTEGNPELGLLRIEIVVVRDGGEEVMAMDWIDLVERRVAAEG